MIAAEDYNTWLRIAQLSNQFLYLPHRLGYYMQHNSNISQKDMSLPGRHAVLEFMGLLSEQQKLKLEATLRYTSGQFHFLTGNFTRAKEDLLYVVKDGGVIFKINSLVYLLKLIVNRIGFLA